LVAGRIAERNLEGDVTASNESQRMAGEGTSSGRRRNVSWLSPVAKSLS
jgi:hypothetical protein